MTTRLRCLALALACMPLALHAQSEPGSSLADLSIEQLGEVVVTSVVRQPGLLADAPASIYVISAADIRRAGALTLTDALRLAPNLLVAQADTRNFAVSARGFASTLSDKMLVLIDGRTIYSPLFSGVFWDVQDVLLDDVERIEVISGPGATIWGANAVNGIINILTRPASATQGTRASLATGAHLSEAAVRHGGSAGAGLQYRIYAKRQLLDNAVTEAGQRDGTATRHSQAGLRVDWTEGADSYTVQGDAYRGTLGQPGLPPIDVTGMNVMARVVRALGPGEQLRLQGFYDRTERLQAGGGGGERLATFDTEIQYGRRTAQGHHLVLGGGYRAARDRFDQGPVFQFLPGDRRLTWSNLFAQGEFVLDPAWRLTVGLKVEGNPYTGKERLPNVRLAWQPGHNSLLWTALSRNVRSPARIDRDLHVPGKASGLPFDIVGGPTFAAELAEVLELGYRADAARWSFSLTAFGADFSRLRTLEPVSPGAAQFMNKAAGSSRGLEAWGTLRISPTWRIDAGGVRQRIRKQLRADSVDLTPYAGLGTDDPDHFWQLRSTHELDETLSLHVQWRQVGRLPAPAVPAYQELDAGLVWQAARNVELVVAGRNLWHRQHLEYSPAGARQFVPRAVHVRASVQF